MNIPDNNVKNIWTLPDGTNPVEINPDWYANNGTPICMEGDDMEYSHTEITVEGALSIVQVIDKDTNVPADVIPCSPDKAASVFATKVREYVDNVSEKDMQTMIDDGICEENPNVTICIWTF